MSNAEQLVHVLTIIDGETEELVGVVEIRLFDPAEFRQQFDVDPTGDPDMRDRYSVGPDDIAFLKPRLSKPVDFNLQQYAYFIEAALKG